MQYLLTPEEYQDLKERATGPTEEELRKRLSDEFKTLHRYTPSLGDYMTGTCLVRLDHVVRAIDNAFSKNKK